MNLKKKLMVAIITIIFPILLICCATIQKNETEYKFPDIEEVERIDDGKNITVKNKDGETVFYYDAEKDTVTVPYWYWIKIINYAINTGGLKK